MKTEKQILESIHDDVLKRKIQIRIDLKIYKGMKPDDILRTENKQTAMGIVQHNTLVKDEVKIGKDTIKKINSTLIIIENLINSIDK